MGGAACALELAKEGSQVHIWTFLNCLTDI